MSNDPLLNALKRQEQLLTHILNSLNRPALGLHNSAGSWKIYCNRQHNCPWYRLVNMEPVPITETDLTGYIRSLKFETCERRNKTVSKLLLTVEADRIYILEAGHDTQFSKGLMMAIATLEPNQLLEPVTIMPVEGDDGSVLFCRLFVGKQPVKTSYDENTDWREVAKKAISNVKTVNLQ